jgi:ppGpp synthetase/RelA/SpoT-type nucleotidyltranferase
VNTHDAMLGEFERLHPAREACAARLRDDLEHRLRAQGVAAQRVSVRVKSTESVRHKLARPERTYASLWSVTDLVGLRVTVYFEDAIDVAARLVEEAFAVDWAHSVDKLRPRDESRFGYRSLHYVCALRDDALPPEARFEVQLRTVVQHAWAEVEHDLGYKSSDAVPAEIRRRFSRVAGLLEIADEEFVSIRRALEQHAREAREALHDRAVDLPLDAVTLDAVARSAEVSRLDQTVADALGLPLGDSVFYPEYLARMLRHAGLGTTRALRDALARHGAEAPSLVRPYFDFASRAWHLSPASLGRVHLGYALFFLAHVVILRAPDPGLQRVSRLTRLYQALDYPDDERTAQRVAGELLAALERGGRAGP